MRWHGNIKCNCGHTQKDHWNDWGWCHHSKHPRAGKCGCTWFHPSDEYLKNNKEKAKAYIKKEKAREKIRSKKIMKVWIKYLNEKYPKKNERRAGK